MGNTTNRSGWLFGLFVLYSMAVAAALGWLALENHRLREEVSSLSRDLIAGVSQIDHSRSVRETASSARIDEGFARIGETFASWSAGVAAEMRLDQSNMNAVLNRALGKVIPVVLPEDYESKLKSLETQVADKSRWPASWTEAQAFMGHTAVLLRGLPSWAEADYLPRLTPIRWAAAAFVICNVDAAKVSQEQTAREAQELADVAPTLAPQALRAHLEALVISTNETVAKLQLEKAVLDARAVIDGATDANAIGAASAADSILQANLRAGYPGTDLRKLREDLRVSIVRAQVAEDAKGLGLRWERLKRIQASDPSLFEAGTQATFATIANARVALATEGLTADAYDSVDAQVKSALTGLAKENESRMGAAVRAYQKWALGQLDVFDWRFAAVQAQAEKDGSVFKADNGGWSPQRFQEVRIAMSEHLIPINTALLDTPVQRLFQSAFDKGWIRLAGTTEQIEVAKASAIVEKKSLGAFVEGGNQ